MATRLPAQISPTPYGVFVDGHENIFIADTFNNAVREVTATTGVIQTVAGNLGTRGYSGDNGPATSALLDTPYGVFVDSFGNIFVADTDNSAIREVVAVNNNTIQTIAGNGTYGFSGDGGSATSAELAHPLGVMGESAGNLFIADSENSRVRQLLSTVSVARVPTSATVPLGGPQQFAATVTGASNLAVTWQVNNVIGGNSTVGIISSGGLYQAPPTLPSSPTMTVSAISNANGSTFGSVPVTIAASGTPTVSVTSAPSGVTNVYTGAAQTFNASVAGETNTAVNWEVGGVAGGNSTLGTISAGGVYTGPAAVPSPSLVIITAVSQASASVSGSYPITVVAAPAAPPPAPQTISPGSAANYSPALKCTHRKSQPADYALLPAKLLAAWSDVRFLARNYYARVRRRSVCSRSQCPGRRSRCAETRRDLARNANVFCGYAPGWNFADGRKTDGKTAPPRPPVAMAGGAVCRHDCAECLWWRKFHQHNR
jgi:hypothetical protein